MELEQLQYIAPKIYELTKDKEKSIKHTITKVHIDYSGWEMATIDFRRKKKVTKINREHHPPTRSQR